MKSKAINAKLNERSKTFENWLKYEVTIQHVDGSTEVVPAYGKDLQDALSRVVHDSKAIKLSGKIKRIPNLVWVSLWFIYVFGWAMISYEDAIYRDDKFDVLFFFMGVFGITSIVLFIINWFRQRNRPK